jgi:hypothetical protein
LLNGQTIGVRVDVEQQIAFGNPRILHHGEFEYAPADRGCDVDNIGIKRAIARGRTNTAFVQSIKGENGGQSDDRERNRPAMTAYTLLSRSLHIIVQSR